jgi:hypothetical protein
VNIVVKVDTINLTSIGNDDDDDGGGSGVDDGDDNDVRSLSPSFY